MPDVIGEEVQTRRQELLSIAAELFAERGYKATTVRDIADAAGILSGSLYHHFASKEAMVDELLDSFQTQLFERYDAVVASGRTPREKLEDIVRLSFDAVGSHRAEVAIFQSDSAYLATFARFHYLQERNRRFREMWLELLRDGIAVGELRSDLNVELVYRFLRDTVWVAVSWYRPGGDLSPDQVADQYLAILLEGIATTGSNTEKGKSHG
jgi:AcrR family transcriptional regulator